jgi:putative ABC transport system substrate-binding protein
MTLGIHLRCLVVSASVGIGLVVPPVVVYAQPAAKVHHRIAILGNQDSAPWEAFRQGMRDLGYVDGRNISIESRWSEGKTDRLPAFAIELVALRPDVIVASGTQAIRAAKQATTTIPIVMAVSSYPDKIGLVESLAHPGGNVTGLSNFAPALNGKRLELLKEIAPNVSRVAFIWNPASPVEPFSYRELLAAAPAAGMEILSVEGRSPAELPTAFAAVTSNGAQALMAIGNPVNYKGRQLIADFALRRRIPSVFATSVFVEAGGFMSYAPSWDDLFRRAATYVDKILKGANPGELPVEQPAKFELVINLKTAKAIGLTVPRSILLRADRIIE